MMKVSFVPFKPSLLLFCAMLCVSLVIITGCTDSKAVQEKEAREKDEMDRARRFEKAESDLIRFERLKRDAQNGDQDAIREMKQIADKFGE